MKVAICDDTNLDLKNLDYLISTYSKEQNIPITIEKFDNSNTLINRLKCIEAKEFDIFFLDIIMQQNGIDVAAIIRNTFPTVPIIFTTSSREYAIDAFKVHAFDYLLKPISKKELTDSLNRITNMLSISKKSVFTIKVEDFSYVTINVNQISYIEYTNRRLAYHMEDGATYTTTSIRSKFLESLPFEFEKHNFLNCHSSFIINMNKIKSIDDNSFIMQKGDVIPISKKILKTVRDKYTKYLLGE